jgi:hypothetical protein
VPAGFFGIDWANSASAYPALSRELAQQANDGSGFLFRLTRRSSTATGGRRFGVARRTCLGTRCGLRSCRPARAFRRRNELKQLERVIQEALHLCGVGTKCLCEELSGNSVFRPVRTRRHKPNFIDTNATLAVVSECFFEFFCQTCGFRPTFAEEAHHF